MTSLSWFSSPDFAYTTFGAGKVWVVYIGADKPLSWERCNSGVMSEIEVQETDALEPPGADSRKERCNERCTDLFRNTLGDNLRRLCHLLDLALSVALCLRLVRAHRAGLVMRLLLLLAIGLLAGCAANSPYYLEAGLGYRINSQTDQLLHTDTPGNGRNPTFEVAWGRHFNWQDSRCEIYHWSHLRDGGPFNDNAEQYELRARCVAAIFGSRN